MVSAMTEMFGRRAFIAMAITRFVNPAESPFTLATQEPSAVDTLRVRLLSMPHAKHAPRIASDGQIWT